MGLWPSRAATAVADVQQRVTAGESFPSLSNVVALTSGAQVPIVGAWMPSVPRSLAESIPALQRGVALKVTTVAGLPIERIDAQGNRVDVGWMNQPEADRPRFATLCDVGYDLEYDGRAYLYVHERESTGAPKLGGCEYISLDRISTEDNGRQTIIRIDGRAVRQADVIGFQGYHSGIRHHGARIIRTALALEAASQRYADTPMPSERLVNKSDYEYSDAEIDAILLQYKTTRNTEGVGFINANAAGESVGWDAAQLQLVEARQFTATQLANLVGIPAQYIAGAAASSGGNVTYANVTQDARALIDYGLKPMIRAIESRLSMTDVTGQAWQNQVTPRGTVIRFQLDGLLRGNPLERAQLYAQLIPLGVLTVEEARAMEDLAPSGRQQQ